MDLAQCSLNSVTVKGAGLTEVADLAEQWGFGGVGLWRDVLDGVDLTDASARLRRSGLRVSSVCRGGMFPQPTSSSGGHDSTTTGSRSIRPTHWTRTVSIWSAAPPTATSPMRGGRSTTASPNSSRTHRQPVYGSRSSRFIPMMASSRSVITSLGEANDMVEAIGSDLVGIGIDSYHVWWDAALPEQITRAGERLFSVQLADWVTPIHGELSSRGMPGEGCIDMTGFVADCRSAGYDGLVEVEVLSDRWWAEDPKDAVRAATEGLVRI